MENNRKPDIIQFPVNYLRYGYNDSNGNPDERYNMEYAKAIGETLSRNSDKTGKSKIRTFYEDLIKIESKVKTKEISIYEAKCDLNSLVSRANLKILRGSASSFFGMFIKKNSDYIISILNSDIDYSKKLKELNRFVRHFEAVICFTIK